MDPKTGRCAILFPHGVLFRDEEREMRQKMIKADVVEAVLGLGPNLFYNSPMEACVVICRSFKPKNRKGKVLFINAVDEVTRQQAQSFLTEAHIAKIANSYKAFASVDGFTAVATNEEILANNGSLNIVTYVKRATIKEDSIDLSAALQNWKSSSTDVRASASNLFKLLKTGSTKK
jgi:type I restriction enzyme M protein